jgi:PAS domain S-box-containing protein
MENPMNHKAHRRLDMWIHAFPRIAGGTAIVAGSIVIVGWILDIQYLKSILPNLVSMKPNAAIAFVLTGMALLLHASSASAKQRLISRFLASLVLLVGLVTIAEYAFNWDAGIDQLLFNEPQGTIGTFLPGRMALSSAMSFCLVVLSLLMRKRRSRWSDGFAQGLALFVGMLGMLALVAYVYGLQGSSGFAVYTRMALHTSVVFILLSAGMICLQPDVGVMAIIRGDGPGGFILRRLMLAVFGVPVVLGWLISQGEMKGLYGPQFGDVIDATLYIAIFVFLVWTTGRSLNKLDAERKNLEQSLHKSEKEFKELFDDAPVAYHELDREGRIIRINQTELQMLGYRAEEMQGHFVWEFLDDRETSQRAVLAKLSGTRPPAKGVERLYRRKDRTTITVLSEDRLLLEADGHITGIRTILQDITKLKRAQEHLKESEVRHRNLIQNLGEGIGTVDEDERFMYTNPAAETILGVPAGGLIGRSLQEFMEGDEFERMREQTKMRRQGETASYDTRVIRPDGAKRDLHVTVTPSVDDDGTFIGTIGIFRDITYDKMVHDLLVEKEKSSRLTADISALWVPNEALPTILKKCTEVMVMHLDAAFARIWTLNREENVLELRASAGLYTHLDGPHGRVPVGKFKIGLIAEERKPHVTNSVIGDPRVGDQEWAMREGMVSFAGYPLIVDGQILGVIAMFARRPLSEFILNTLELVADKIAVGIERKRAEEALREAEAHYRLTVENATDLIYNLDSQGWVTSANAATSHLLGYTPDDLVGRRYLDFVRPDFRKRVERNFITQWLRKTPSVYYEAPVLTKDGRELWLGQNVGLVYELDDVTGFFAVSRDITERKRADTLAEALYSISQAIHSTDSLNELFGHIHRALSSVITAKNFFIALLSDDKKKLFFPYDRDECGTKESITIEADDSQAFSVEVLRSMRPLLLDEKDLRDRYSSGRNRVWVSAPKCWLGVPLMIKENAIGVMAVQDYSRGDTYGQNDVALLESAASQIAIAIERKRAEEAIRKNEERYRGIFENVQDVYYESSIDGTILEVSRSIETLSKGQYNRDDLIGRSMSDFYVDASERQALISALKERGRVTDFQIKLKNRDSSLIHCSIVSTLRLGADGRPERIVGSLRDISERKRAEEELRKNTELFRVVSSLTSDYIFIENITDDGETELDFLMGAVEEITGYTEEEYRSIGHWRSTVHPDDLEKDDRAFQQLLNNEKVVSEIRIIHKNGSTRWMGVYANPIWDEKANKLVGISGAVQDITERKRVEKAVIASELEFRRVWESTFDGMRVVDGEGTILMVNEAYCAMIGKGREELVGKPFSIFTVESLQRQTLEKHTQRFSSGTVAPRAEKELVLWNGRRVWFEVSSSFLEIEGRPKALLSIFRDVTDRKRAENVIKDSESSLRYAQEIAKMGSWEWNMVTQETNWSDSYFVIHGFKPTEVEPSFELFRNRIHPEDVHLLDETHANIMKGGTPASFELRIIQPDGTVKWIQNNIVPVVEDDKLVRLKGVIIDVTERKRTEQERESLIIELKTALENVKTLGGLVPICAHCKKIRDDKGYWNQLEKYLGEHTDAKLTHGLCPDCAKIYFPEAAAKAGL